MKPQNTLDLRKIILNSTRHCVSQQQVERSRSAINHHVGCTSPSYKQARPFQLVHGINPETYDTTPTENLEIDTSFQFHRETKLPIGTLVITPLSQEDISAASVVLTRAFATSPQGIPIDECRSYCQSMVSMPPKGVFLIARLYPFRDDTQQQTQVTWLRPGQESRVIATAAISFDPISRDSFLKLKPPDEDAYLCNIAVDPSFRRQSVARCMLSACEELSLERKFNKIYLHVRLGDDAARLLYESSGFIEIASDSWLVKLRNQTPTALLAKKL